MVEDGHQIGIMQSPTPPPPLANANNEDNLTFKDIKLEQKLLHMLDSVIASNEIKEKTLINRLEESRNEIYKREQQLKEEKQEIENQRINIANINQKLSQENMDLEEKLKRLALLQQSVQQNVVSPTSPTASASSIGHSNSKSNSNTNQLTITTNTNDTSIDSQKSPLESPPDYVKKLKSLNSEYQESTSRFEYRLGQIQQNSSKITGRDHSTTSSLNSGSNLDLENAATLTNGNSQSQSTQSQSQSREESREKDKRELSSPTTPENQTFRRRRNRVITNNPSTTTSQQKDEKIFELENSILELQSRLQEKEKESQSVSPSKEMNTSLNETKSSQVKYKLMSVVANRSAVKKIKEILSSNTNNVLSPTLTNEISEILTTSEEKENYKLLRIDKFEYVKKAFEQIKDQEKRAINDRANYENKLSELETINNDIKLERDNLIAEKKSLSENILKIRQEIENYQGKVKEIKKRNDVLEIKTGKIGEELKGKDEVLKNKVGELERAKTKLEEEKTKLTKVKAKLEKIEKEKVESDRKVREKAIFWG